MKTSYSLLAPIAFLFAFAGCSSSTPVGQQFPVTDANKPMTLEQATNYPTVLVEEFSDIECPACRKFAQEFEAVEKEMPNVTFRYYHFPLDFHKLAYPSAIAVECVRALEGEEKRAQYLHEVFAPAQYSTQVMMNAATTVGMDAASFEKCVKGQETKDIVEAHIAEGIARGLRATPTIYINGKKIEGGMSRADLKKLLEAEVATKGGKQ